MKKKIILLFHKLLNNKGSIFTETVMKVGIVVIIGGVIINILSIAIPNIFGLLIEKIKTVLGITG